jgi:hypothetical protein
MKTSRRRVFSVVCLVLAGLFSTGSAQAVTINDRSGGAIYWGGKYINIKPSHYTDSIGRRTKVNQMEVIMSNDIVTVKITGPYFFNYAHNVKGTREASPGDLYISSQGWKVSGKPPHNKDVFEASEGWDYVVSFENKKLYKLNFSAITMTSALPSGSRYRAQQAWRGGYGEAVDDAQVILTDRSLTFIFSVRNVSLRSEIGVHWTMKCGNDIIEGSASIPPIAMNSPPAAIEVVDADPADSPDTADLIPASMPIPAAASFFSETLGGSNAVGSANAPGYFPAMPAAMSFAIFRDSDNPVFPPVPVPPLITPQEPEFPPLTSVPEPSVALLLLTGLIAVYCRKKLLK